MDWSKVLQDMVDAVEVVAKAEWPKLRSEAEEQFRSLTQVAARIEVRKVLKEDPISETNARFLFAQYELAARNVMFSIEGIANILIERAYNAALAVLRDAIKTATGGWVLI
jgi:hypothetical protein